MQLLNIQEYATDEHKTYEIDKELRKSFGDALIDNDPLKMFTAYTNLIEYKNRHIEELQETIKHLHLRY